MGDSRGGCRWGQAKRRSFSGHRASRGRAETVPAAEAKSVTDDDDAPDMGDLPLSDEARQKLGAKVSERIRKAKARYKAEAEQAKAALELN